MKISEHFKPGGKGVMATAGKGGRVNTAVYATPHIVNEETVAWGMTEGRTFQFAQENPHASYLYFAPGAGFTGIRLALERTAIESSGKLLETIRSRASESSGPQAGSAVKHVVYYKVLETRPLV